MKKLLPTLLLIFGLVFTLNSVADALPFPDDQYKTIGSDEFPDPDIIEGSGMVSRTFDVTAGDEITFNYNMLSSEPSDSGPYNDYFGAMIIDPVTDRIYETFRIADIIGHVDAGTFELIHADIGVTGPHGSEFSHQTGVIRDWITVTGAYENVSLAFGIFDVGDADVDTAVLLDNISIPLPSGAGGFDNGLLGDGGFIYQHDDGDYMYGGNVHLLGGTEGSIIGVDTTDLEGTYAYMSTGPGNNTPIVPEPISSVLFLIGGATLGFRRFRQNK